MHGQIHDGDEQVDYSFMVGGPDKAENRHLREAMQAGVPLLYFLGVAPGRYAPVFPTYVAEWSASDQKVRLTFGVPASPRLTPAAAIQDAVPSAPERRYGLRLVRERLHQATFREAVLAAYGGRCAISRLPEPRLLDAAHIVADRDQEHGQPIVPNGLPLSKVHHAAFDANLIGIDPDFRIHVSPRLLDMNDGPMLEQGIKAMAGRSLLPPDRAVDRPDRDRLAERFEAYRSSV